MSAPTNLHTVSRSPLGRIALSVIVLALSLVVLLFALTPGSGLRPASAQTGTGSILLAWRTNRPRRPNRLPPRSDARPRGDGCVDPQVHFVLQKLLHAFFVHHEHDQVGF